MSQDKTNQILEAVVTILAIQEQAIQRLDAIDKRLSNLEIKMSKIEKCVSYENADFVPHTNGQPV